LAALQLVAGQTMGYDVSVAGITGIAAFIQQSLQALIFKNFQSHLFIKGILFIFKERLSHTCSFIFSQ